MVVTLTFLLIGIAAVGFMVWVLSQTQKEIQRGRAASLRQVPLHVLRLPSARAAMRGPALVYSNPLVQPAGRQVERERSAERVWIHAKAIRPA